MMAPVFLWTDILFFCLIAAGVASFVYIRSRPHLHRPWRRILSSAQAIVAGTVLGFFVLIALLDSIHFVHSSSNNQTESVISVLDLTVSTMANRHERSYSSPFSHQSFDKQTVVKDGEAMRQAAPLVEIDSQKIQHHRGKVVFYSILQALLFAASVLVIFGYLCRVGTGRFIPRSRSVRLFLVTGTILAVLTICCLNLSQHFYILGTGKVGQDIFYYGLKSIRTGVIIGTVTTLVMLPFAVLLGVAAGYFGGKIDDMIQFVYITLSSIPGVLLIASAVLTLQVFIAEHEAWFTTILARADMRLLALCCILGVTSWTGLCRLLRAETLKVREMDYIVAAKSLGASHFRIIWHHILPNVFHIVLITLILDFSALVLAEAVLSYVGVGVDPTTYSWGNMINAARVELSRTPMVWWPLTSAFIFMFALVLSANCFADVVRDAFDPRNTGG